MASVSCTWMTVAQWAELTAQDPEVFENWAGRAGTTYVRVCEDGTNWLNETFVSAMLMVP